MYNVYNYFLLFLATFLAVLPSLQNSTFWCNLVYNLCCFFSFFFSCLGGGCGGPAQFRSRYRAKGTFESAHQTKNKSQVKFMLVWKWNSMNVDSRVLVHVIISRRKGRWLAGTTGRGCSAPILLSRDPHRELYNVPQKIQEHISKMFCS